MSLYNDVHEALNDLMETLANNPQLHDNKFYGALFGHLHLWPREQLLDMVREHTPMREIEFLDFQSHADKLYREKLL